jgi:membrane protein YdbS with pleckstrin-like domain
MCPVVNKGNKKTAGFEDFIRIKTVLRAPAALLIAFIVAQETSLESFIAGDGELALLIPAGFLFLAKPAWRVLANTYEIRRNRISAIHGFIAIDSIDVSIDRIITVEYKQSVAGRLSGFGNVYTSSAAQDKPDIVMRDIVHPKDIRDGIRSILKEREAVNYPALKGGACESGWVDQGKR